LEVHRIFQFRFKVKTSGYLVDLLDSNLVWSKNKFNV
jgi:hypothetical protein